MKIRVINTPPHRGELKVIIANASHEPYEVRDGDCIAQIVVATCEQTEWEEVTELDETRRSAGGFGHTGR